MLIELTSRCNSLCKYCFRNPSKKSEINFNDYYYILHNPHFFKLTRDPNPYLVGQGEPLLNKDFWRIISYKYPHGVRKTISTNAKLLNEDNIPILVNCCDNIQVSIDSLNKDKLKKLRDIDLEFLLDKIRLLKKYQHDYSWLQINFLISPDNFNEIPQICEFALEFKIPVAWEIVQCHYPKSYSKASYFLNLQKKLLERRFEILEIIKSYKQPQILERYFEWGGSFKYCAQRWLDICITSDLYFVPCCFKLESSLFNFGYLYDQKLDIGLELYLFKYINKFDKYKEIREDLCYSCKMVDEIIGW